MKKIKTKKAYITIITVITISAVSIATILSLFFSGFGIIESGQSLKDLAQSEAAATACVEEALEKIKLDNNYETSFSTIESTYSCQVDISKISDQVFEIQSTGICNDSYKKFEVRTSQINPKIIISSWESVNDF